MRGHLLAMMLMSVATLTDSFTMMSFKQHVHEEVKVVSSGLSFRRLCLRTMKSVRCPMRGMHMSVSNDFKGEGDRKSNTDINQVVSGTDKIPQGVEHNQQDKGKAEGQSWKQWSVFDRKYDREIISMAIPSYTAVLLDPITTLIDVSFIGRLPEAALSLAGVGMSNTILNYFGFTFFFMVVTTTTTLAQVLAKSYSAADAHELSSQEPRASLEEVSAEGSRVIAGSIIFASILGLASSSLAWYFAPNLVALVGGSNSAEAFPYAVAYMRSKSLGIPATIIFFSIIGAYRGYKDLTTPLVGNVLSSLCKVCMGYIFLFKIGLGVAGAGLADALSRYCSCIALTFLLVKHERLRLKDFCRLPERSLFLDLCAPGGALTFRKLVEQFSFTATTRMASSFGSAAVASSEIVRQCWSLLSVLWWPMSVAGQTLVATLLAEWNATKKMSKLDQARKVSMRVMGISTSLGMTGAAIVILGSSWIPSVMTSSEIVQSFASQQLPLVACIMPLSALCDVVESIFIAAKFYQIVVRGMMFGACGLALVLLAGKNLQLGMTTVWLGIFTLYLVRTLWSIHNFNQRDSPIPPVQPWTSAKYGS
mmetsp:Transcript_34158/g.106992  ORF Transcript_34158/g.106992 Transcript_34158/m.106992 type:complete len:591 (-) Transcript_34158:7406-9178(-)